MSIKNALAGAVLATALVPAAAHASPTAGASTVVKATVRAEVDLERAQALADSTTKSVQKRAQELHQRSRAQIIEAAAATRRLVQRAQRTGELATATAATLHLTAALDADAQGQVAIAAVAGGRLQSGATKALAADAALEVKATLALAKLAESTENGASVIQALAPQMAGQLSDVTTDLEAATNGRLSQAGQSSADLAIAIDMKASATYADVLARVHTTSAETVKPAVSELLRTVANEAVRIRSAVERSTASAHTVTVSGSADVTLGDLALGSAEGSAHGLLGLSAALGSVGGDGRISLHLPGLPG
jgi:hypothetical protein